MEANRMTALTSDTGATAAASRDPSTDQCQGCALLTLAEIHGAAVTNEDVYKSMPPISKCNSDDWSS